MAIGIAGILMIAAIIALFLSVRAIYKAVKRLRQTAKGFGYSSLGAYLRAVPQTEEEKRDAVDLALKGLILCVAGLVFPPVILFGLFPLFWGARKLISTSMGLGLVDDALNGQDEPGR